MTRAENTPRREPAGLTAAGESPHATSESSIRGLLAGLIDYAGLFPPASLQLDEAARRYAGYRKGESAWALGRFILPATRLVDLTALAAHLVGRESPWRIAVIGGVHDVDEIARFNAHSGPFMLVDTVEGRASTVDEIHALKRCLECLGRDGAVYVEVPTTPEPDDLIRSLKQCGLRAKVRTGGVKAEAFPTAASLIRFFISCAEHNVIFKATAGLHHPFRGDYPLTYEDDADHAPMFGFLNVFLAALLVHSGCGASDATAMLEERDLRTLAFDRGGVSWRGHRLSTEVIDDARAQFAASFGSCSFTEPVHELRALGML